MVEESRANDHIKKNNKANPNDPNPKESINELITGVIPRCVEKNYADLALRTRQVASRVSPMDGIGCLPDLLACFSLSFSNAPSPSNDDEENSTGLSNSLTKKNDGSTVFRIAIP